MDISAITIFPFIFLDKRATQEILNHELIHIQQYRELFVIGFYFIYFYDFINALKKYKNIEFAYSQIRFEQEAFDNAHDKYYILERDKFAWKNYKL